MKIIACICALVVILFASCQDEQSIEFDRYYTAGAVVYQGHCQNCHGSKGEGLGDLIPPLTDSAYLRTNDSKLPCIINSGTKGKIRINNKDFDGDMPATSLTPIEIAQVLTYIKNSFGNKQGLMTNDSVNSCLISCK